MFVIAEQVTRYKDEAAIADFCAKLVEVKTGVRANTRPRPTGIMNKIYPRKSLLSIVLMPSGCLIPR